MLLLVAARILVRFVPLRFWRSSVLHPEKQEPQATDDEWLAIRAVIRAVNRATQRMPIEMVCLPRAMVAQWMLARRGFTPRLVFGVARGDGAEPAYAFHAWVEIQGRIVVGDGQNRTYQPLESEAKKV